MSYYWVTFGHVYQCSTNLRMCWRDLIRHQWRQQAIFVIGPISLFWKWVVVHLPLSTQIFTGSFISHKVLLSTKLICNENYDFSRVYHFSKFYYYSCCCLFFCSFGVVFFYLFFCFCLAYSQFPKKSSLWYIIVRLILSLQFRGII